MARNSFQNAVLETMVDPRTCDFVISLFGFIICLILTAVWSLWWGILTVCIMSHLLCLMSGQTEALEEFPRGI